MTTPLTHELEPEEQRWLNLNGYDSLEAWGRDSDYIEGNEGEWYSADDAGDPFAGAVDLAECLTGAIEAQTTMYEVTVSNVFEAIDQADAVEQMVAWLQEQAGQAGYRWERIDHLDPHETGFIDADGNDPVLNLGAP